MCLLLNAYVLVALASPMSEGSVRFSPGFPTTLPFTGSAVIHARAKPNEGFVLHGAKLRYWEGGSVLNIRTVPVRADGTLSAVVISGLRPGVTYNVILEFVQSREGENQTIASAPIQIVGR